MNCKLHTLIRHFHPAHDHVREHMHTVYEVIFYITGEGTSTVNGVAYHYQKGSIVLVAPGEVHDETADTDTDVFACSFEAKNPDLDLGTLCIPDCGALTEKFYDVLNCVAAELKNQQQDYETMISYQLCEMVLLLKRMVGRGKYSSSIIEYAKRVFQQNAIRGVDLNIMAESIGYSYDRFRHLFKESTNQSPNQYILGIRIASAKQLLSTTNLPVSKIAEKCGFKDMSNFVQAFRRRTHVTPNEYRRMIASTEAGSVQNMNDWQQLEDKEG